MKERIEQIELFHALKLQPISKRKIQIWVNVIKKKLITANNIKDCCVLIEKFEFPNIDNVDNKIESLSCKRGERIRKKKRCCIVCPPTPPPTNEN